VIEHVAPVIENTSVSNTDWALLYVGGPVVLGFVATVLTRSRWPKNGPGLALIGVVLAFGFVVLTYYRSAQSFAGSQGDSDGEMFLGRWWEPTFTVVLALIGYFLWLIGVGAGVGAVAAVNAARTRHKTSAAN
jgi:hypothetical protein